MLKRVEKKGI